MTIYVDKFEIVTRQNGLKRTKNAKNREKKMKNLQKLKEIADEVEDLGADYVIIGDEKGYVIERKSISDLFSSVFHSESKAGGRLFDQAIRVRELASQLSEKENVPFLPILLVEGNLRAYNNIVKKRGGKVINLHLYRSIIAGVMELGVHVIESRDFQDTLSWLELLNKRAGKKKRLGTLNVKKSLRSLKEEAVHMVYAVSKVGMKKAKTLLEKYGTVKNIVNLDETTLMKELGPKTGKHFYKVVNTNFSKYQKIYSSTIRKHTGGTSEEGKSD